MRYHRRLPGGLPPALRARIYAPGRQGMYVRYGHGMDGLDGMDGFFSSFKKIAGKALNILAAPMKLAVTAPVKLVTGAAREIGLPVKKIDSWLNKEVKSEIKDVKTGAPIAAGVALSIVTGGAGAAVLIPTIIGAAGQLYNASKPPAKPGVPMAAAAGPNPVLTPSGGLVIPGIDVNAVTGQPVGPTGQPVGPLPLPLGPDGRPVAKAAGFLPPGLNPVVAVAGLAGIAFLSYYLLRKTPVGKV